MKIAILPGDGIGPEIIAQAVKVLNALDEKFELETAPVGGAAYAQHGHPLPEATLALAKAADAVLFGAVGDFQYDNLERALRPEQAILGLRKQLGLFANFRRGLRLGAARPSSVSRRGGAGPPATRGALPACLPDVLE